MLAIIPKLGKIIKSHFGCLDFYINTKTKAQTQNKTTNKVQKRGI